MFSKIIIVWNNSESRICWNSSRNQIASLTTYVWSIYLLKVIDETLGWLLVIKNILWRCVVKTRIIFLSRQIFLINQKKHISTLSYARNTIRKNKWKTHPLYSLIPFFSLIFSIRDECRIIREKSWRNENDYVFWK